MKLIIDIDEEMYKQVIASDIIYVLDDTDLIMFENAIANGKLLQAELEEIKAEMIKIKAPCGSTIEFKYSFIQILDNHISELKGENNGNS